MKRMILICICLLQSICGFSQNLVNSRFDNLLNNTPAISMNHYSGQSSFVVSGTKYKCQLEFGWYSFERMDNTKIDCPITFKDGTIAPSESYQSCEDAANTDQFWSKVRTIFRDYRSQLKNSGKYLMISFVMDSTGHITEVKITFKDDPVLCSIPPQKFVELEQAIKSELIFKWDDRTKELYNWLHGGFLIYFENPSF